jgi:hypothetical protein
MRAIKLITRFYSGIFLVNFLITLSCLYLVRFFGNHARTIITTLFWYKVITIVLIFYSTVFYRKHELYYYQNLGVSKLKLAISTSVFDVLLWLVLVSIAYKMI